MTTSPTAMNVKQVGALCLVICGFILCLQVLASSQVTDNWYGVFINVRSFTTNMTNTSVAIEAGTNSKRFLIFQCKKGQECGGLADRQKGIVVAYITSQILGVRFGIDINKPCVLNNYLQGNSVDWEIPLEKYVSLSSQKFDVIGRNKERPRDSLGFENITSYLSKDVIYFKANTDLVPTLMKNPIYHNLTWTKGLSHYDVYKYVLRNLFKLSPETQRKLDTFFQKANGSRLLCAHMRMGRSATMPIDVPRPNIAPNISAVIQFLQNIRNASDRIFLATDSEVVRKVFRETFKQAILEVPGRIIHVNLQKGNKSCEGFEKAILDQRVLEECDTLLMSYSGFSRVAALLRGRDDGLYEVIKNNITVTKRQHPSFLQKY